MTFHFCSLRHVMFIAAVKRVADAAFAQIFFFFNFVRNQQSEYKVFCKLMGWLWVNLVDVLAWWVPLLRGDLVHRITGQLATVVSVFIRRYLVEWGGGRGFEWISSFIRHLTLLAWMTSSTVGIPRSSWTIALVTYHGASTVARCILDWHLCMIAVLDLEAQPHNSMP